MDLDTFFKEASFEDGLLLVAYYDTEKHAADWRTALKDMWANPQTRSMLTHAGVGMGVGGGLGLLSAAQAPKERRNWLGKMMTGATLGGLGGGAVYAGRQLMPGLQRGGAPAPVARPAGTGGPPAEPVLPRHGVSAAETAANRTPEQRAAIAAAATPVDPTTGTRAPVGTPSDIKDQLLPDAVANSRQGPGRSWLDPMDIGGSILNAKDTWTADFAARADTPDISNPLVAPAVGFGAGVGANAAFSRFRPTNMRNAVHDLLVNSAKDHPLPAVKDLAAEVKRVNPSLAADPAAVEKLIAQHANRAPGVAAQALARPAAESALITAGSQLRDVERSRRLLGAYRYNNPAAPIIPVSVTGSVDMAEDAYRRLLSTQERAARAAETAARSTLSAKPSTASQFGHLRPADIRNAAAAARTPATGLARLRWLGKRSILPLLGTGVGIATHGSLWPEAQKSFATHLREAMEERLGQ